MDACEATKVLMSRVQNLDPENASKIMGYILIQDGGDEEVIRLAFGPQPLLLSCVNRVKACLGLPSNTSSAPNPVAPLPPRNVSYPAANQPNGSSSFPFYGGRDFADHSSVMDQNMSPSGRSDSMIFPYGEDAHGVPSPHPHPFHRRSCSVNDAVFLSNLEEGGSGHGSKSCMHLARGFCKNGSLCSFLHSENGDMIEEGSPGIDEFLRMKAIQKHRFATMASGAHHSFPYSKPVNILNDNQRCGPRNGFSQMGLGAYLNSSSRQIYLTFPADSTFKEEDVSSYFSMFGPVHDVRIPYQLKRMFGFVTFVYPETVKIILAKGNPHYVCDSRVLVKPYKEKGKILEKKQSLRQHEPLERGDYSACLSPSGVDSRELFDIPIESRRLFNAEEIMLWRKLEEAEIQHALDLQSRRMTNLKLMDLEILQHNSHRFLASLFTSDPVSSSPRQQQFLRSRNFMDSPDAINQDVLQEFYDGREKSKSSAFAADDEKLILEGTEPTTDNILSSKKHQHANDDDSYLSESLEHILPYNLFASPTKLAPEKQQSVSEADNNNITVTNNSPNNSHVDASSRSPLRMASLFYSEATSY